MLELLSTVMCGLLGFGTGIFTVLSLIEKPVWSMMWWNPSSPRASDEEARTVHMILKRVIHLLPPTMITAMTVVTVLVALQLWLTDLATMAVVVAAVFYVQLVFVLIVLFPAIRGVDTVPSDGEIGAVRSGLGTLARVHHQGLCMTATTLIVQWTSAAP